MALIFCKASSYRTAILFWLSWGLVGGALSAPRVISAMGGVTAVAQVTTPAVGSKTARTSQVTVPTEPNQESSQIPLSGKQKRGLVKANFEKMKHDAKELSDLAKALEEELSKSNENILSLDVVDKADKIEKLAKKIKGNARGF